MTVFLHFYQGIHLANDSRGLNKDLVWLKSGSQPIIIAIYEVRGEKIKGKAGKFSLYAAFRAVFGGLFW